MIAQYFINDLAGLLKESLVKIHPVLVFSIFLVSESLLGLIPPDFFILWANQFSYPWMWLFLLALVSYVGGLISYKLGRFMHNIPRIRVYLDAKFHVHIKQIHKLGGFLIVFAALFPLPYSAACMAAGIVRYPFNRLLWLGLTRILRFVLYALVLFKVL